MCKFFSFISDGNGNFFYFNDEQRKKILRKELESSSGYKPENADSHSSIARFYFKNGAEDSMNKFEFNPLTKVFEIDQLNTKDDSRLAKSFAMNLDFKSIVRELILKKIENPLEQEGVYVDSYHVMLLKKWSSVRASVSASVWASVSASVWASVSASVWASVRASVRDSVRDSVRAYTSSFFALTKDQWKNCEKVDFEGCDNPFQSAIDLWELGLVPSFDGSAWRLHAGRDAKIVFEISKEDLEKWSE